MGPPEAERLYFVGIRNDLAATALPRFQWPEGSGGGCVGDILEVDGEEVKRSELTEAQWAAVQRSSTWLRGGAALRFVDPNGVAATLTSSYKSSFKATAQLLEGAEGARPRFFTRRECARLMGFPEEQVLDSNSPNRAYHQLGNAVCPLVIQALGKSLLLALGGNASSQGVCEVGWDEHTAGAQPPLREQLKALSIEQMAERTRELGGCMREPDASEFVAGYKVLRREELLGGLCTAYAPLERRVLEGAGVPLPEQPAAELLQALRLMSWKENVRPGVAAAGYVVLKRPHELKAPATWPEHDPRAVRRRVWHLAEALLRSASAKAAAFPFTAIAVSNGFRGSPHVDKNDVSVQYALSLGDFEEGGHLCVEESALVVRSLKTKGALVCIDGRFPHWVSGYSGERYSVIWYCSSGPEQPRTHAVHEV